MKSEDIIKGLEASAIQIRDEKRAGSNTANRVGSLLLAVCDALKGVYDIQSEVFAARNEASEAKKVSGQALQDASVAKNAVKTLDGLDNTTTAQEILASQVSQIEENRLNVGIVDFELSSIAEKSYCLGKDGWYLSSTSKGKHIAIPVSGYANVEITCGNVGQYIGFLTSEYKQPISLNETIPYSEVESSRIWQYENTTTLYKIPFDCAFLILGTEDGGGNVHTYINVKFSVINSLSDRLRYAQFYDCEEIDIDDFGVKLCSLGVNGWYYNDIKDAGYHKAIPVSGYTRVQVKVTGGNDGGWIGFVTNEYTTPSNVGTIPYSYRYPYRIWQYADTVVTYDLCPDIEYLIVCVVDGNGYKPLYDVWVENSSMRNVQHELTQINKSIKKLKNNNVAAPVTIDFDSIEVRSGCLGSKGWYVNADKGSSHKAIPVKGGSMIDISINGTQGAYLGFLTSSYIQPTVSEQSVPYCSDTPERIWQYENTTTSYNIPSDCAYVVVSVVDGAGKDVTYGNITIYGYDGASMTLREFAEIVDSKLKSIKSANSSIARLRLLGWNIGHYCYGTGTSTSVTDSNYLEQRTAYRELFNKYGADLMGLIEYSDIFNASTGESAKTAIIPQYMNKYFGDVKNAGYVCNGIVTNLQVSNISQITLQNEYYGLDGKVSYMGSSFVVCVVHLPWQTEEMNISAAQTLLERYAEEEKVVIIGDFNIYDTSLYDMFANEGYDMANHGYLGDIVTRPETGTVLDNIMVKGGKILHTEIPISDLSDHLPIIVDIVI